jgi:AraC family transcriptional regulator
MKPIVRGTSIAGQAPVGSQDLRQPAVPLRRTLNRSIGQTHLRCWRADAPFAAPAAAHAACELAWVESGEVEYRIGRQRTVLRAGDCFFVPSGVEHATSFAGPIRAGALGLAPELVAELADAVHGEGARLIAGTARGGDALLSLARVLVDEASRAEPGSTIVVDAMVEAIATVALRGASRGEGGPRAPKDPRIARAVEHMRARYVEPLSVDDLAKAAGISRFHFSRMFREEVGSAPYQYLLALRLDRAAELLRGGRCSVTEAALSVGFQDFSRFGRMFRARFRARPTDVLARARNA